MTFRLSILVAASSLLFACSSGADNGSGPGGSGNVATASNIEHLVVVIQENTAFDVYYGQYCTAATGTDPKCNDGPDCCEAGPATDPSGAQPTALDDAAHGAFDPDHSTDCMVKEINGGSMDRYVTGASGCSDARNFAYADAQVIKPYRDLAAKSALADRWFQPVVGSSSSNDMYFATAKFEFTDNTKTPDADGAHCGLHGERSTLTDQSVGDLLADAGVPWAFYLQGYQAMVDANKQSINCADADPACPAGIKSYPCDYDPGDVPFQFDTRFRDNPKYMRDFSQLSKDLSAGRLPSVVFVKALGFRTEHPGYKSTIKDGVDFVTGLVDTIESSSYADSTLILYTYDESGGFFDHVPPPPDSKVDGKAYGPRVPTMAIGSFAKQNFISHVTLEHSSVVKFIEWNWLDKATGELGARDAVVNNIGSLLDATKTGTAVPE
jgi:phospholipase C